jgi:hypothetical protein
LHVKYREYPPTIKNNSYGSILLVWKTVQITLIGANKMSSQDSRA